MPRLKGLSWLLCKIHLQPWLQAFLQLSCSDLPQYKCLQVGQPLATNKTCHNVSVLWKCSVAQRSCRFGNWLYVTTIEGQEAGEVSAFKLPCAQDRACLCMHTFKRAGHTDNKMDSAQAVNSKLASFAEHVSDW